MSGFRRRLMMAAQGGAAPMPNYLAFTALEDGTFTLTIGSGVKPADLSYIEYSIDGTNWVRTDNVTSTTVTITTPTITSGDKVYWRGKGSKCAINRNNSANASIFTSTGRFNASGHIMSLLKGELAEDSNTLSADYSFVRLFYGNTNIVDASELILASNVTERCYEQMFEGCSELTEPPQLPCTTVATGCYFGMFNKCKKMVDAPILPSETLAGVCYYNLFRDCTTIRYIVMLATDISASQCMSAWVNGTTDTSDFVFVKHIDATWDVVNINGTLSKWTIIYYNPSMDKYYLSDKTTECDDHGNVIN